MISQDESITKLNSTSFNRHYTYAKYIKDLYIIVKTLTYQNNFTKDNIHIYPTNSLSKLTFFIDAYKIGSKILASYEIDLITTQDAFLTGFVGYLLKKRFNKPLNLQVHADFFDNKFWLNERFLINRILNYLGKWLLQSELVHPMRKKN
jgi:hypothetical protein